MILKFNFNNIKLVIIVYDIRMITLYLNLTFFFFGFFFLVLLNLKLFS